MFGMIKTGFVLLAIGGAFWAGERYGAREQSPPAEKVVYVQVGHNDPPTASARELRDCNDAMYMWIRALEIRSGDWEEGRALPGFRFLNPEGEVVTYHVPPLRKQTGSLHIGPNTVHREAGWTP